MVWCTYVKPPTRGGGGGEGIKSFFPHQVKPEDREEWKLNRQDIFLLGLVEVRVW